MNYLDRERLKRVKDIFSLNFRITRLYATYLELFPELITKEMIDTLTEDTDIDKKDAFIAILCEALGLSWENESDRPLIREYLPRSVRVLDAKRYTENKYYQNIKIEDIKDGEWEFKNECYPAYRGVICDDMLIDPDFTEIPPLGFFEEDFRFPAVLEGGNEWMTLTPVDLDTSEEAIAAAHGKVVTFGLGLGYYAYMVSEKENVSSVTVVEKSPEVIKLFEKHILPQFKNAEKIKIVNDDAFSYAERVMPSEQFDYAFVDTWRDASDGAPMYKKMKALEHLSPCTEFSYWIERFLISRIRAERYAELCDMIDTEDENAPKSYEEFLSALRSI